TKVGLSAPTGMISIPSWSTTPHQPEDPNTQSQKEQYETSVPTVADRVAQTVVKMYLEPKVEPIFHPDSYGYRPGRSALDAVGVCRQRCWRSNWVIDLDIQKFFDTVPWGLVERSVVHLPNFDSRTSNAASVSSTSPRSSRMASPTRMPVTANSPIRVSCVAE